MAINTTQLPIYSHPIMGRKNNRAQSPPPAPEPESSAPEGEPAPEARPPLQVLYCAGAWPKIKTFKMFRT